MNVARPKSSQSHSLDGIFIKAMLGDAYSQLQFASRVESFSANSNDRELFLHWYHEAALRGNGVAEEKYAEQILMGESTLREKMALIPLLKDAVAKGSIESRWMLGALICSDPNTLKSEKLVGLELMREAAVAGSRRGQAGIAAALRTGMCGVTDRIEAKYWGVRAFATAPVQGLTRIQRVTEFLLQFRTEASKQRLPIGTTVLFCLLYFHFLASAQNAFSLSHLLAFWQRIGVKLMESEGSVEHQRKQIVVNGQVIKLDAVNPKNEHEF